MRKQRSRRKLSDFNQGAITKMSSILKMQKVNQSLLFDFLTLRASRANTQWKKGVFIIFMKTGLLRIMCM